MTRPAPTPRPRLAARCAACCRYLPAGETRCPCGREGYVYILTADTGADERLADTLARRALLEVD